MTATALVDGLCELLREAFPSRFISYAPDEPSLAMSITIKDPDDSATILIIGEEINLRLGWFAWSWSSFDINDPNCFAKLVEAIKAWH